MAENNAPQYYLVEAKMLPEIFIKVTEAKALLETGEVQTVADATARVGISRSAFYKYKDSVSLFRDMKRGHIITFHIMLRNKAGILSSVLGIFADSGANILTINQSIPGGGAAAVTISADTADMAGTTESLMDTIRGTAGVIKIEVLAG